MIGYESSMLSNGLKNSIRSLRTKEENGLKNSIRSLRTKEEKQRAFSRADYEQNHRAFRTLATDRATGPFRTDRTTGPFSVHGEGTVGLANNAIVVVLGQKDCTGYQTLLGGG